MTMNSTDLAFLSARAALRLFASGTVSPSDVVAAQIERAETFNNRLIAFGDCYFEDAKKIAAEAERRWRSSAARPLEGITIAVKDAQQVAGQRTTYGSPAFRNSVAEASDPMIGRLLQAGAIILARSVTSELCFSGVCRSPMWGTSHNPWNSAFSPGGSSGGSAAALAAGFVTLATGTDMGGSIRIPASACGVVGYKPPHGRNPDGFPANLDPSSVCGPLARSVSDVALVQNVIAGPHPLDHHSLPATPPLELDDIDVGGVRVAVSLDLSYRAVDPAVRKSTLAALDRLAELGCLITAVDLGWTEEIDEIFGHWFSVMWPGRTLIDLMARQREILSPALQRVALAAENTTAGDILKVLDIAQRMNASFGPILSNHDVLVCPSMTVPAVPAEQDPFDPDFTIDGKRVDPEFGYSTTHQFNILSNCPALSLPSGFSADGVPIGLQIVGRPFDDGTVFRVAAAFEAARGAWYETAQFRPAL